MISVEENPTPAVVGLPSDNGPGQLQEEEGI